MRWSIFSFIFLDSWWLKGLRMLSKWWRNRKQFIFCLPKYYRLFSAEFCRQPFLVSLQISWYLHKLFSNTFVSRLWEVSAQLFCRLRRKTRMQIFQKRNQKKILTNMVISQNHFECSPIYLNIRCFWNIKILWRPCRARSTRKTFWMNFSAEKNYRKLGTFLPTSICCRSFLKF